MSEGPGLLDCFKKIKKNNLDYYKNTSQALSVILYVSIDDCCSLISSLWLRAMGRVHKPWECVPQTMKGLLPSLKDTCFKQNSLWWTNYYVVHLHSRLGLLLVSSPSLCAVPSLHVQCTCSNTHNAQNAKANAHSHDRYISGTSLQGLWSAETSKLNEDADGFTILSTGLVNHYFIPALLHQS